MDTGLDELNSEAGIFPQRIAFSRRGMISSAHRCATQAGIEILEDGGNAIDAAVAAAFTLGVCEPMSSGLGGQTMALIYVSQSRKTMAIDGSSRAPNRATLDILSKQEMRRGHRATTVPSTPAVLDYLCQKYGFYLCDECCLLLKLHSFVVRHELNYKAKPY
jgi:gamma-glutamyltranspeptidase/glutathione hydrolase